MSYLNTRNLLAAIVSLIAMPAIAGGDGHFQTLTLGGNASQKIVSGYTTGSFSLSSIANSDKDNNPCIGYGSPNPDHVMVLENNFAKLKLQVDSGGRDTTLLVRGPNSNTVRCSFGSGKSKDAAIVDNNWKAGKYEIWVGSIEAGQRWDYRLSVEKQ